MTQPLVIVLTLLHDQWELLQSHDITVQVPVSNNSALALIPQNITFSCEWYTGI